MKMEGGRAQEEPTLAEDEGRSAPDSSESGVAVVGGSGMPEVFEVIEGDWYRSETRRDMGTSPIESLKKSCSRAPAGTSRSADSDMNT